MEHDPNELVDILVATSDGATVCKDIPFRLAIVFKELIESVVERKGDVSEEAIMAFFKKRGLSNEDVANLRELVRRFEEDLRLAKTLSEGPHFG